MRHGVDLLMSSTVAKRRTSSRINVVGYFQTNLAGLDAARRSGVVHFVLLSAICVQKPLLASQQAKLAFEAALHPMLGCQLGYRLLALDRLQRNSRP
jgi:hypothetical protein